MSSGSNAFEVKIGSDKIPARVSFLDPIGPGRRANIRIYLSRRVPLLVGNEYDLCETGGSMHYMAPYVAKYLGTSENVGKVTIVRDINPGVVNMPVIWEAIVNTFEDTRTPIAKMGLNVDAADLCRFVLERTEEEIIKTFITPNLTDHEVREIKQDSAKLGGGSKKKRRTCKKLKAKQRTTTRALLKKWKKNEIKENNKKIRK